MASNMASRELPNEMGIEEKSSGHGGDFPADTGDFTHLMVHWKELTFEDFRKQSVTYILPKTGEQTQSVRPAGEFLEDLADEGPSR